MPNPRRSPTERLAHRLIRLPLTARRAGQTIAIATVSITIIAGVVITITDPRDFSNVWLGMWWAIQTVTTVGYGDVVPHTVAGRIVASLVMITGIAFLTVVTATITSAFIESAREHLRRGGRMRDPVMEELTALRAEVRELRGLVEEGGGRDPDAGGGP